MTEHTEHAPATPQPKTLAAAVHDGLAAASLVLGILWLGGLGSLLAVIFGHCSNGNAKRAGRKGSGMAVAGLVLGYLGLAAIVIVVIVIVVALSSSGPDATQQFINCSNATINGTSLPSYCPAG
jgi:amino acid transporter